MAPRSPRQTYRQPRNSPTNSPTNYPDKPPGQTLWPLLVPSSRHSQISVMSPPDERKGLKGSLEDEGKVGDFPKLFMTSVLYSQISWIDSRALLLSSSGMSKAWGNTFVTSWQTFLASSSYGQTSIRIEMTKSRFLDWAMVNFDDLKHISSVGRTSKAKQIDLLNNGILYIYYI